MNLEKAIEITEDRLANITRNLTEYNESERKIANETIEYLIFIKQVLINMKGKDAI